MFLLQVVSFVFEIILIVLFGGFLTVSPEVLIERHQVKNLSYKSNEIDFSPSNRKDKTIFRRVIRLSFSIVFAIITIYFIIPYLLDIPRLVSGKFDYATGYVNVVRSESKSFYEYVNIEGRDIKFFFSSNVEENKQYRIGYLPNTKRAIFGELLNNDNHRNNKKISFPLGDIFIFIVVIAALVIISLVSPYLGFKLLGISSLLFYPTCIFIYINNGFKFGTWFSFDNGGLNALILSIFLLLTVSLMYFGETRKSNKTPLTMIFVQLCAILNVSMFIAFFIDK